MYTLIKNIAKVILPKSLLQKNERLLRKLVALQYRGDEHQCNLCDYKLKKFVAIQSGDLLCPSCGSNGRARSLWKFLEPKLADKRVLHFSPSSSLKTKIEKHGNTTQYTATDYVGEFETENHIDIQDIDLPDNNFDLIICYHVLEHVARDQAALKELYRVLAVGGHCYVQTPFKDGETYEDPSIKNEADRLKHYGQKDHLRIYSAKGLKMRMEAAGFAVTVTETKLPPVNYYGLKALDIILEGSKWHESKFLK